jgi:hypothetical protein
MLDTQQHQYQHPKGQYKMNYPFLLTENGDSSDYQPDAGLQCYRVAYRVEWKYSLRVYVTAQNVAIYQPQWVYPEISNGGTLAAVLNRRSIRRHGFAILLAWTLVFNH